MDKQKTEAPTKKKKLGRSEGGGQTKGFFRGAPSHVVIHPPPKRDEGNRDKRRIICIKKKGGVTRKKSKKTKSKVNTHGIGEP